MGHPEMSEVSVLHGEKAVEALNDFIVQIEQHGDELLTPKQVKAVIKIAKGLIFSIRRVEKIERASLKMLEEAFAIRELEEAVKVKRKVVEELQSRKRRLEQKLERTALVENARAVPPFGGESFCR